MKIVFDAKNYRKNIERSIKKYCYSPEHNYINYFCLQNGRKKNVVFDFGRDRLILATVDNRNRWSILTNGVLAAENERFSLLERFLDYALIKRKSKKVVLEFSEDIKREFVKKLGESKKYHARRPSIWYNPVYNMSNWDRKLKGKKWKKLRNIKNRFYKKYRVRVVESSAVGKEKLKQILFSWLKRRRFHDKVDKHYYTNAIDNNFKNFNFTRTLLVNGKPCTITGGWKIPNSNTYYSAIGIFDYSCKNLCEMANIDDLDNLKRHGFGYVDFGCSGRSLLEFKKKFKPEKIYKTYIFSIVRNGIKAGNGIGNGIKH